MHNRLPLVLAALLAACGGAPSPPVAKFLLTHVEEMCTGGVSTQCLEPDRVEAWLSDPDLEILDVTRTHHGIQGAQVLTLATRERGVRIVFRAKWRPQSSAKVDYSEPRVSVAAYQLQKLLLPPSRYVIPPAVGHCFPLERYRAVDAKAEPTIGNTDCAWGSLSYWLETVESLEAVDDTDWFEKEGAYDGRLYSDNAVYREAIASVALLTYLCRNGDAHSDQFLMRRDPARPHVYLVDNSMGFGAKLNSALAGRTQRDWTRVLAHVPEDALDRLFGWNDTDLKHLASLERHAVHGRTLQRESDGPAELASLDEHEGFSFENDLLHVGLTPREIERLRVRIEALRLRRERGQLPILPIESERMQAPPRRAAAPL